MAVAIVLHTMGGSLGGSDSWFRNPDAQVSAHFGVGLGGDIHQYVDLADTAWANGILEPGNAWAPRFGPDNPNPRTTSIETEDLGLGSTPVSEAQYRAVLALCRWIRGQQPGIRYLATHRSISPQSRVHCPGERWTQSGRFAQLANELGLEAV